jgi:KipI family sensor histidine kinase inhibitor
MLTHQGYDTVGYSRVTCDGLHDGNVKTRKVGEDGLLLEVDDPAAWFTALWQAREQGEFDCVEIVPAATTVLLSGITDMKRVHQALERTRPSAGRQEAGEREIPIRWDGEDLAVVAEEWGVDPAATLKATRLTAAFCGFAPGFAYLTGLPERLHLPRRATPRPRVPAGSLATAGPYVGIYPRETPGGWHLLGRTTEVLFDPRREPPALLTPGMTVRLADA